MLDKSHLDEKICSFCNFSEVYKGKVKYNKGICPVAEELNDKRYMGIGMCSYEYSNKEIEAIIIAFNKVWDNIKLLKSV